MSALFYALVDDTKLSANLLEIIWPPVGGPSSCSSSYSSSPLPAGSSSHAGAPSSRASHHHLSPRITPSPTILDHHKTTQDKPGLSAGPSQNYSLSEAQAVELTRHPLELVSEEVSILMGHGMLE